MSEKWYKKYGDRKIVKKMLKCKACKKEVEHTMKIIFVGSLDLPIFEYRTTCSNCGAMRRLPREPS